MEPEKLDRRQVMARLGVGEKLFRWLVKQGYFPPGVQVSARSPYWWDGRDVAAYEWLRLRGARVGQPDDDPAGSEEPADD